MKRVIRISTILVFVLSLVLLCSCAPKDLYAARQKMEKKGYTEDVSGRVITGISSFLGGDSKIEGTVTFSHEEKGSVTAVLYKEKADAKEAYESARKNADASQTVERSGKWVVIGDKKAVRDFL